MSISGNSRSTGRTPSASGPDLGNARGRILGLIPARGGSKGVRRKNLRPLAGKPLLAWTVEAARDAKQLDRVILSSEDPEIIAAARQMGCEIPFVRPGHMADDDTPGIVPVLHAVELMGPEFEWVVLLQPTSPLRTAGDIDHCVATCLAARAPAAVTVCRAETPPQWMYHLTEENRLQNVLEGAPIPLRRQDAAPVYELNGAVYVARCSWLKETRSFLGPETVAYVMPPERSVDIDTEADLIVAEHHLNGERSRAGAARDETPES